MSRSYHNKKEFVCPHCKKDFTKKRMLKSHIKDTHPSFKLVDNISQTMIADLTDDELKEFQKDIPEANSEFCVMGNEL